MSLMKNLDDKSQLIKENNEEGSDPLENLTKGSMPLVSKREAKLQAIL